MVFLNDETILEQDAEGNPTKIHGYACAYCPGGPRYVYKPPSGWEVDSCEEVLMGSHGCCSSCVVAELVISLIIIKKVVTFNSVPVDASVTVD